MTDLTANTLRTWAGDASDGQAVEIDAANLHSAADHIDYLAGVVLSMDTEIASLKQQIERMQRQLENQQYRRAS